MIIWVASYPKSGNTWVRSFLSAYLYSEDGIFSFDLLKKIEQFPAKKYFNFFLKDFSDIKKVSDYWIAAQQRINLLKNEITFMKTHSALCTLENNTFTNKNNTKAVIYVVRDPRNLITSLSHHYSQNTEESYNFLIDENKMIFRDEVGESNFGIATVLGSWSKHYASWCKVKFVPTLIIKYEDLIKDTQNSFITIINFLNKIMNIKFDEKRFLNTVKSCSFENLVKKEKAEGFVEAVVSEKNNEKLSFFYLGKKNNWKNLLDPVIEKRIREAFPEEMKELGYI